MGKDSPSPEAVDEEMAALQEEFTQLLRERKQRIEDLLKRIGEAREVEGGEVREADGLFEELAVVLHKLAGSCAMYGYSGLGKIAGERQNRFEQDKNRLISDHEALNHLMAPLLEALRENIETGPGPGA